MSTSNSTANRVHVLLSRLHGVIQHKPDAWYARCPAHDDKSPSLSVRDAGDKVLLHCFAGCAAEDVLIAVDLKWTDLYPDRWEAAWRAGVANPGKRFFRRLEFDPMDVERWILKIAAESIRKGEELGIEDLARVHVARLRLAAAKEART